jgi:single-strand DNA-binding protein
MYYNEAHITLCGNVVTQPVLGETRTGVPAMNMRVAWTQRRMDQVTGEWTDAGTSYCTVSAYKKLAENAATCLRLGDPVVVRGRVTLREFEDRNGHKRNVMEVDAISFGHDLSRGVATFHRVRPQTGMTATEFLEASATGPAGDSEAVTAGFAGEAGRGDEPDGMLDEAAVAALAGSPEEAVAPF